MDFLAPLLRNEKAFFLAYDHGFEHGAEDFNAKNYDPNYILDLAVKGHFTAVILQKGLAEKYYYNSPYSTQIPLIVKLNGKTDIVKTVEPYSSQNCSVKYAKMLGAKGVGYTIYLGSEFETEMLETFGQIQEEAHNLNMAAIAWIYPRGKNVLLPESPDMIKYAARLGLELGADMVKLKYSGDKKSFSEAVKLAGKTKIVLSGGRKELREDFYKTVKDVMAAGGTGVAVGRNVWQDDKPVEMTGELSKIIWSS
jgi:class I fructose-bisphosphate aldolase